MSVECKDLEVAAYAIKLPPLWPLDPMLWFVQIEAQFVLRRSTVQLTKFHHILANLSLEIETEVRDLLMNPPEENPYGVLKEMLIKRTTPQSNGEYSSCLAIRISEIRSLLI